MCASEGLKKENKEKILDIVTVPLPPLLYNILEYTVEIICDFISKLLLIESLVYMTSLTVQASHLDLKQQNTLCIGSQLVITIFFIKIKAIS